MSLSPRRMERELGWRVVKITEVNTSTNRVEAEDQYGTKMLLDLTNQATLFQVPQAGEVWVVTRRGSDWALNGRYEAPDVSIPLTALSPGDARVAAPGDVYMGSGGTTSIGDTIPSVEFDVTKFPGSGSNDIARANAAMLSAESQGGGIVYFPPIGREWLLNAIAVPSNVWVRGGGPATKIKSIANAPASPLGRRMIFYNKDAATTGNSNIWFSDMYIDGNVSNGNALDEWYVGFEVHGMNGIRFFNLQGQNIRGELIGVYKSYGVRNQDVEIRNIDLYNLGWANRQGIAVIDADRLTIDTVRAKRVANFIIDLEPDDNTQTINNATIRNIVGYNCGAGVAVQGASGNYASDIVVDGVSLRNGPDATCAYGVFARYVNHLTINDVVGCRTPGVYDAYNAYAILCQNTNQVTISRIISYGADYAQIYLGDTQQTSIDGCILINGGGLASGYLIQESGTADNTRIGPTNQIGNGPLGKAFLTGANSDILLGDYDAYVTVASTASMTIPQHARTVSVTGTAAITNIYQGPPAGAGSQYGRIITLIFTGTAAGAGLTDGGNLKLAGSFAYTPDDSVTLRGSGGNWHEVSRSVN